MTKERLHNTFFSFDQSYGGWAGGGGVGGPLNSGRRPSFFFGRCSVADSCYFVLLQGGLLLLMLSITFFSLAPCSSSWICASIVNGGSMADP